MPKIVPEEKKSKTETHPSSKNASLLTGPGPAATIVGNPKPTAAIAKPSIKNKDKKNATAPREIKTINSTSLATGPGPAGTAIGNPKPIAAIAKISINKKESANNTALPKPAAINITASAQILKNTTVAINATVPVQAQKNATAPEKLIKKVEEPTVKLEKKTTDVLTPKVTLPQ